MVERVNSRVLGDAKNRFAFGVNAPLGLTNKPVEYKRGMSRQQVVHFLIKTVLPVKISFRESCQSCLEGRPIRVDGKCTRLKKILESQQGDAAENLLFLNPL